MVFKSICILVLWTNIDSALEGLRWMSGLKHCYWPLPVSLGFIWGLIAGYSSFLHQVKLASHKFNLDMTEKVTIIKIPTKLWLVILNFVHYILFCQYMLAVLLRKINVRCYFFCFLRN